MVRFSLLVVVKKMFHFPNAFFYNHLYDPSAIREIFLKKRYKISLQGQIVL